MAVRTENSEWSVRRLARALEEPASSVGRWLHPAAANSEPVRVAQAPATRHHVLRDRVRALCAEPRHATFGYRRICALLRREGRLVNRKTVWHIMHDLGLVRPRVSRRPQRPKRVERMQPTAPDRAWQIDMTSFQLSTMQRLFLVVVIDCYTRRIVGWTLDRRCRAGEWVAAVRMALEAQQLFGNPTACHLLTLRSDNGAQPCSKAFTTFLASVAVEGQYTGYDAPDDNAYVERVIRTIKEEEVWPNTFDSFNEAHQAIDNYIRYYNQQRIHSALGYRTPNEFAAAYVALAAA
jgi:putative transposase